MSDDEKPVAKRTKLSADDASEQECETMAVLRRLIDSHIDKEMAMELNRLGVDEEAFRSSVLAKCHASNTDPEMVLEAFVVQEFTTLTSLWKVLNLDENAKNLSLTCTGSGYSHVITGHKAASHDEKPFSLYDLPMDELCCKISRFDSMLKRTQSLLMVNPHQQYYREADLQHIVHLAVTDAVQICNMILKHHENGDPKIRLSIRQEAIMLSTNKPDHTVISDQVAGIDVITMETKVDDDDLKDKEQVVGQIYDFMKELELFGHPNVFGLVTTFVKTWVFWLDDDSSKIALHGNRFGSDNVKALAASLRKPSHDATPSPAVPTKPESDSPPLPGPWDRREG